MPRLSEILRQLMKAREEDLRRRGETSDPQTRQILEEEIARIENREAQGIRRVPEPNQEDLDRSAERALGRSVGRRLLEIERREEQRQQEYIRSQQQEIEIEREARERYERRLADVRAWNSRPEIVEALALRRASEEAIMSETAQALEASQEVNPTKQLADKIAHVQYINLEANKEDIIPIIKEYLELNKLGAETLTNDFIQKLMSTKIDKDRYELKTIVDVKEVEQAATEIKNQAPAAVNDVPREEPQNPSAENKLRK